jgi:hypothetical protein
MYKWQRGDVGDWSGRQRKETSFQRKGQTTFPTESREREREIEPKVMSVCSVSVLFKLPCFVGISFVKAESFSVLLGHLYNVQVRTDSVTQVNGLLSCDACCGSVKSGGNSTTLNPLKPSANYMCHMLEQSATLHFVFSESFGFPLSVHSTAVPYSYSHMYHLGDGQWTR